MLALPLFLWKNLEHKSVNKKKVIIRITLINSHKSFAQEGNKSSLILIKRAINGANKSIKIFQIKLISLFVSGSEIIQKT
jgi:hypothetical protein